MGDPADMTVVEARARGLLAALRSGRPDGETLFETVAEEVFRRHGRQWKLSTLLRNRHYLNKHIQPRFAGLRIADITPQEVRDWFAAMHATPVSADRSMPVLSVIMTVAETDGLRPEGSNQCKGIRRYRRQTRDRFLSEPEIARLDRALSGTSPAVALIRLLALMGCRKSKIVRLKRCEVDGNRLRLEDSKTGLRIVYLSSEACEIIERCMISPGEYLFPSPRFPERQVSGHFGLWYRVRRYIGIEDIRLNDLRHSYTRQYVIAGVPLPVVSKLLGHSQCAMTLRYAHAADRDVEAAAERIGARIAKLVQIGED